MIIQNLKSENTSQLHSILSRNKNISTNKTNRLLFKSDIFQKIHGQNSFLESEANMVMLIILAIILIIILIPIIELISSHPQTL